MAKDGAGAAGKDGLAETLEEWSKVLQDIGSSLYLRAFADEGIASLGVVQLRYFELITRNPGVTPGELAETMAVTKPTVAGVVAALARKGLVRKGKSEADGRSSPLFLTENAERIAAYRRSMYALMARRIRRTLSARECAALSGLMRKSLGKLPRKEGV